MPAEITILFEDAHLIAVAKGPGELVVPSPWTPKPQTLLGRLQQRDSGRVWAVHRLDRDTSGVVLFARSRLALKSLHDQFQRHQIQKVYHAIVQGVIAKGGGVVTDRLAKGAQWTQGRVARAGEGRSARTEFIVLERFHGYTLVEARPLTGRFHQIRIHFQQLGHPLAYDPVYNPGASFLLSRVSLHASQITLRHPATNRPLEIGCPWPDDFSRAVQQLRQLSKKIVALRGDLDILP